MTDSVATSLISRPSRFAWCRECRKRYPRPCDDHFVLRMWTGNHSPPEDVNPVINLAPDFTETARRP